MYLLITVALLFIGVGYAVKSVISNALQNFTLNPASEPNIKSRTPHSSIKDEHFDPFVVRVYHNTNQSLESIFDVIIDWYILSWYRTFSDNIDFVVQVRLHLQYLTAVLIKRAKSLGTLDLLLSDCIRIITNHVEHIYPLLSGKYNDSVLEESVLRNLGPHLHVCLSSRASELAYVRALVNRLLPYVSLPPSLTSFVDDCASDVQDFGSFKTHLLTQRRKTIDLQSRVNPVPHCSSTGTLYSRTHVPVKLGANRAANSFLLEILSTCVLLPAMDAVANPDFLNKTILEHASGQGVSTSGDSQPSHDVPVLKSYIEEWKTWISKRSTLNLKLEPLLQKPESCFTLVRHMKSIKSTVPISTVLLMHEIDQRVRNGPLPPDVCREIRSQVYHVLMLVRHSAHPTPEDDVLFEAGTLPASIAGQQRLFELSDEFDMLLRRFLEKPAVASTLFSLIDSPVWNRARQIAFTEIEQRYLPLFAESSEYLSQRYAVPRPLSSPSSRPSSPSPQHQNQVGIFGLPLKTFFANNVVEGKLLSSPEQDVARLSGSGRTQWASSVRSSGGGGSALTIDSQHQLHSHYLLHTRRNIDMSAWHVFIPGLSRPEIRVASRRLIDQLVPTPTGTTRSLYLTRPHDAAFRDKISGELFNLQSAEPRTPQLASQFYFTVRTEHLVNGVWQPIDRVDRKYSEFYVLEQKLQEFHGSAITRQLPRKQFTPRTFEFLESKREAFEEYLQFLLTQPFLRSSELLHNFLTSKEAFSSNVLFELNLSRFAKSVPLKLTRERGQYLDNYLVAFYLSCNPQPIRLEPITPDPKDAPQNPAFPNIALGCGVGTLGGIDSLTKSDVPPPANPTRTSSTTEVPPPVISQSRSQPSLSTLERRSCKRTWLDNRLRVKMFWNNAGLLPERRKELHFMSCEYEIHEFPTLVELPVYVAARLLQQSSSNDSMEQMPDVSLTQKDNSTDSAAPAVEIPPPQPTHPVEPWDITHDAWGEALLNGPVAPPPTAAIVPSLPCPDNRQHSASSKLEDESVTTPEVAASPETVSIDLSNFVQSLQRLTCILKRLLVGQLRQFALWMLVLIRGQQFKSHVDWWLRSALERFVRENVLTDQFMASGLDTLKAVLFEPYSPSTELDKFERRDRANMILKEVVSKSRLTMLLDAETVEKSLDRVFMCFQYPKWNKQLSYLLLDRVICVLFPELVNNDLMAA